MVIGQFSLVLLAFTACTKQRCDPPAPITIIESAPIAPKSAAPESAPVQKIQKIRPGDPLPRTGDEIVVCGQLFHVGAPVITWMDPEGYDAYRVEQRFGPMDKAPFEIASLANKSLTSPNRYGLRKDGLTPEQIEALRGGGWNLPLLQRVVDQFVMHYDQSGTSRRCFQVMHDERCLSVHFMIDLDGTIYQTLDLKERAWHATTSNTRSIGVEIANVGAYGKEEKNPFAKWYSTDASGALLTPPKDSGIRTPDFVGRPIRSEAVVGTVQGRELTQYDLTPQQYESLIKLTAALCRIFPKIKCDYPRDAAGKLVPQKLGDEELKSYAGIIGHYHIQTNKVDPGPAFQWEKVVKGAQELMAP